MGGTTGRTSRKRKAGNEDGFKTLYRLFLSTDPFTVHPVGVDFHFFIVEGHEGKYLPLFVAARFLAEKYGVEEGERRWRNFLDDDLDDLLYAWSGKEERFTGFFPRKMSLGDLGSVREMANVNCEGERWIFLEMPVGAEPEVSNSLLKFLEEPPPNTKICVFIRNFERTLSTVLSRGMRIRSLGFTEEVFSQIAGFDEYYGESFGVPGLAKVFRTVAELLADVYASDRRGERSKTVFRGYKPLNFGNFNEMIEFLSECRDPVEVSLRMWRFYEVVSSTLGNTRYSLEAFFRIILGFGYSAGKWGMCESAAEFINAIEEVEWLNPRFAVSSFAVKLCGGRANYAVR